MNTALNYVLIFGKLGFPAMGAAGAAVVSLGLLSTAKCQRKAQRSGSQLKAKSKPSGAGLLSTAKYQRKAQRSGSQLKTKSKPSAAGSIWKGKTTPSVNLTPPAAADDLMVLF